MERGAAVTEQQSWPIESVTHLRGDQYEVELVGLATRLTVHRERFTEAGITPPAPDINFDELPVGSVVKDREWCLWVKLSDGWANGAGRTPSGNLWDRHAPYTVVHVPVAPDKRAALHTLGLTDEDIEGIEQHYWPSSVLRKIRAAAREVTP